MASRNDQRSQVILTDSPAENLGESLGVSDTFPEDSAVWAIHDARVEDTGNDRFTLAIQQWQDISPAFLPELGSLGQLQPALCH